MKETLSINTHIPSWCRLLWEDLTAPKEVKKRSHPLLGNSRFVITGGLGSAKTTNSLRILFLWMLRNQAAKEWWIVAPIHARHEDAIIPASIFVLNDLLQLKPEVHYRVYYGKPMKIKFFTGQTIFLHSGDRPERMTSATLGGYLITEPGQMKREVYEKVEDRTRSSKVFRTLGLIEGTPEGDNWYMDEFNIDKVDKSRNLRRFKLHTSDNAHNLEEGYEEKIRRMYEYSPAKQQAYLYGEFQPFNVGNVYSQFADHRNIIPKIPPDPLRPVYLCLDFNATPLTWTAWQILPYNGRNREICVAESSLNCTNLFEAAVEFGMAFPPEKFGGTLIEIWGDRTGHSISHKAPGTDFTNLKKYLDEAYSRVVIQAKKQITPIRASVDITNRLFLYELLLICDHCVNLRRSYNTTEWAAGKADLKKPAGEDHTHHGDTARYRHYWQYKDFDPSDFMERNTVLGINPA